MRNRKLADRLDWNEMLGFEQIVENRASIRSMSVDHRLGAKVGPKPTGVESTPNIGSKIGSKLGEKVGAKPGPMISAKIGLKTGGKPNT